VSVLSVLFSPLSDSSHVHSALTKLSLRVRKSSECESGRREEDVVAVAVTFEEWRELPDYQWVSGPRGLTVLGCGAV
jgi:hypothetical protein